MSSEEQIAKSVVDVASASTVLATLADQLPAWAALFTIIWTTLRIYETETVRGFIKWLRKKR